MTQADNLSAEVPRRGDSAIVWLFAVVFALVFVSCIGLLFYVDPNGLIALAILLLVPAFIASYAITPWVPALEVDAAKRIATKAAFVVFLLWAIPWIGFIAIETLTVPDYIIAAPFFLVIGGLPGVALTVPAYILLRLSLRRRLPFQ